MEKLEAALAKAREARRAARGAMIDSAVAASPARHMPPAAWSQLQEITITPEQARQYRVVALSGGYSRDDANKRLARQHGMVASFSRALTEGLTAQQSQAEFDAALDRSIESIYQASKT